jgi:FkbM family methyltransferase
LYSQRFNQTMPKLIFRRLAGLIKPQYILRPSQAIRRIVIEMASTVPRLSSATVRLPWGLEVEVDPRENIGLALYTQGIYELNVTEALWRLAEPGETAVDAGANLGYMASLLAVRLGSAGIVHCIEPHPQVFRRLTDNAVRWGHERDCARVILHQAALGEKTGCTYLIVPEGFADNQGESWTGSLADHIPNAAHSPVRMMALDDLIPPGENVGVIKLDIQGAELSALEGMRDHLKAKTIRDIVFEEMNPFPADTHIYLRELGYTIFGLSDDFFCVRALANRPPPPHPYKGAPNFLATAAPERAAKLLDGLIWRSFGVGSLSRSRNKLRRLEHVRTKA